MNRRKFLGWLTAAVAVPELLIPNRTIFLPPASGWRGITDAELGLYGPYGLDEFEQRILNPAVQRIAEQIDKLWVPMFTESGSEWIPITVYQ